MAVMAIFRETCLQRLHLLVQLCYRRERFLQCCLQLCNFLIFVHTLTLLEVEGQYKLLALLSSYRSFCQEPAKFTWRVRVSTILGMFWWMNHRWKRLSQSRGHGPHMCDTAFVPSFTNLARISVHHCDNHPAIV